MISTKWKKKQKEAEQRSKNRSAMLVDYLINECTENFIVNTPNGPMIMTRNLCCSRDEMIQKISKFF